ncbi:hypothetical protein IH992_28500 [Candidatus Poribacteria bacterium]|nr:hypothetical protein [Candidatus Poribacteria bacterium]
MLHVDLFPNGSGYCYQNPCNLMVIPDRSFVNAIVSAWQQVGSHKYDMRWRFDTSSPSFLVQIEGGSMGGAFGVMLTHLVQDVPTKKHLVVIAGLDAQGILTPVNEKTLSDKVDAKPDSVKRLIASKDQTCRAGLLTTCPHTSDASHLHLIPVDGCQCFGAASLADASKIATNRMRLIMKRWGAVATGMFLLVLLLVPLILKAVGSRPPNDRFDDGKVGYHWKRVSGVWRVEDGRLKGTSEDNYGGLILTRGRFKDGIFSYEVQGSPSMIWSRRPPYTINKTAVFRYQDQRNHMQLILFTPWPRFGVPRSAEGRMDLVHIVAGKEVYRKTKYYTPVALPEELERRFQVTIRLSGPVTRVFVDENTMSFDYNIDREFTFSVESAFQNDLDSRYISDGLRREFEEKRRISLSENVAVSTQEQGSRWLIVDHEYKRT